MPRLPSSERSHLLTLKLVTLTPDIGVHPPHKPRHPLTLPLPEPRHSVTSGAAEAQYLLSAKSEEEMREWIAAIENVIGSSAQQNESVGHVSSSQKM